MVISIQRHTVKEFERVVGLPENADKLFEFIGGEIVEMVSNNYSSEIAALIVYFMQAHLRESGTRGRITGADGGYIVGEERYIPDVAYIAYDKQPKPSHEPYNPNPPDLAVEVVSPTDSQRQLTIKISNCLAVGTAVWVVRPDVQEVEVYAPGQHVEIVGVNDTLNGGEILPGFELTVKDIFPPQT
jgi:Uma2 family endonuclease